MARKPQPSPIDYPAAGPAGRELRFPARGYLLINVVVWVLLILIYAATKGAWFSAVEASTDRPGTAGLLFIIAVCFAIASLYDYFFDRYSEHVMRKREPRDSSTPAKTPAPVAEKAKEESGKAKEEG